MILFPFMFAYFGVLGSKFMHNAYFEDFRFNSMYFDVYTAFYVIFSSFNAYITLTCIIVHFIDVFSYEWHGWEREREREREREKERENGEIKRKAIKLKEKAYEVACSETAIKFSIDSICPKFLHYVCIHHFVWRRRIHCMFKNVQSNKCMILNEDSLEKLVVQCFIKNKNVK